MEIKIKGLPTLKQRLESLDIDRVEIGDTSNIHFSPNSYFKDRHFRFRCVMVSDDQQSQPTIDAEYEVIE